MLFSFSEDKKQGLIWLTIGLLIVALLFYLGPMLTPFITAAILAYVLNPLVDWLSRQYITRKIPVPRLLAVCVVITLLVLLILALILVIAPILTRELPQLREQIPTFLTRIDNVLSPYAASAGINLQLDIASVRKILAQQITNNGETIFNSAVASAVTGGSALLEIVMIMLFVPMVLFYLLQDWQQVLDRTAQLIPRRWIDKSMRIASEVNQLLAQYLRGQLLVMGILSVYYSVALAIGGMEMALPIGIITGLLVFIPYVGFGLGLGLALISALLQFDGYTGLVIVGIVYGFGQFLESFYLTPHLVGDRIGLHPLVVIFALMAFGQLFGFTGILLALPASAIMSVVIKHLYQSYQGSSFYNKPS